MDPNQQSPTPPQPSAAPPTPPVTPQQPPVPTPSAPVPPSQMPSAPPPSGGGGKKIAIIIVVIVSVVLLLGGGLLFAAMRNIQDRASNLEKQSETNSEEAVEAGDFDQSVSAEYLTDFDEVCKKVAKIDNATAFTEGSKPNIVVLKQSAVSEVYTSLSPTFKDSSVTAADYKSPTTANMVACLTVEKTKDVSGVCEAEQDGKKVTLKKTAVTYNLEVYEATTGKKVGSSTVDGPITSCPFIVYYDASDPRVYGEPDSVKLESAIIGIVK